MKGPRPGGLAEVMADPEYLARTRAIHQQQAVEREDAKRQSGIITPHRPAETPMNLVDFAEGASGEAIPVVTGNPRFRRG